MSYRVFARKYRPQLFEEVVGQEHITRTLQNAIKGNRLAQAYLFVGPRGVGKTSTARILAKALNCQSRGNGPTDNPCGTCDACIEIAEGRSLDVLEIDGASNNSVESIRTLRENAAYAPARGPYKVYLIDEVHMLTTAAFNALLKTLEEPPEHVKFLFATTEAQKVPATILSRCQRFDLRRLTPDLIASHLLYIAGKEEIALDRGAADALARGADGALRDAESMFDQVIAFCGTTIGAADVHNVFGFTPRETVFDLGYALIARDTPAALALVKSQAEAGKDLSRLLGDLVGLLRDVLICKVHPPQSETDESLLGDVVSQEKLLVLLDHFGEAEGRLRWATDKKLQLDVALIKAVHLLEEASLSDVLDALSALRGGAPLPERSAPPARPQPPQRPTQSSPVVAPVALPAVILRAEPPAPEVAKPEPAQSAAELTEVSEPLSAVEPDPYSVADLPTSKEDPWQTVAMALAADSPLKFGWVEDGRLVARSGNTITVEFPPSLQPQSQTLFWPQAVKKIEGELAALLGERIIFDAHFTGVEPPPLEPEPQRAPTHPSPKPVASKTASSGTATTAVKTETAAQAQAISPEELEAFKNDPLIKKALEVFQAEILVSPPVTGA
ncbi:MAG: DNA polymerase III subunit gamma/tau [Chthoniobacterales bacterium]